MKFFLASILIISNHIFIHLLLIRHMDCAGGSYTKGQDCAGHLFRMKSLFLGIRCQLLRYGYTLAHRLGEVKPSLTLTGQFQLARHQCVYPFFVNFLKFTKTSSPLYLSGARNLIGHLTIKALWDFPEGFLVFFVKDNQ